MHHQFGTSPTQTVADIVLQYIPDTGKIGQAKEIVADLVAIAEGTGLSGDQKKKLVTSIVTVALAAMHVSLPASVIAFLIEEAVVLLKGGKQSPPAPPPPPPPAPPAPPPPYSLGASYEHLFPNPIPDDSELKALGFQPGDFVFSRADLSEWAVFTPANAGGASAGGYTEVRGIA